MDGLMLVAEWLIDWVLFPLSLVILGYALVLHLVRISR